MMEIEKEETKRIKGGYDLKLINVMFDGAKWLFKLGISIGSSIRRLVGNASCKV